MNTPLWWTHGKGKQRLSIAKIHFTAQEGIQLVEKASHQMYGRCHSWAMPTPSRRIFPAAIGSRHEELVGKVPKPADGDLKPCPPSSSPILLHVLLLQPQRHSPGELHPERPARSDPGRCASQFGSKRPCQLASACSSRPCHQTLKAASWSPTSSSSGLFA